MNDYRFRRDYRYLVGELLQAYQDAAQHKRRKGTTVCFSMQIMEEIDQLAQEIIQHTYTPKPSICFTVTEPAVREVIAADFRDRVVHHYLYNYLAPHVDRLLIEDCYSCRAGKGTDYAVRRLQHHIRSVSHNYTVEAYCLQMDIRSYFVSIDKQRLLEQVRQTLAHIGSLRNKSNKKKNRYDSERAFPYIAYLLEQNILHDPMQQVIMVGDKRLRRKLPPHKSLLHATPGCGLPIGNLTSQLYSNLYLNPFDQYIKRELGIRHYGRYVDDFFLLHNDKEHLLSLITPITDYLQQHFRLTIHPRKIKITEVKKGVTFLGITLKPYRKHLRNASQRRLLGKLDQHVAEVLQMGLPPDESHVNSILGYLQKGNTYHLTQKVLQELSAFYAPALP